MLASEPKLKNGLELSPPKQELNRHSLYERSNQYLFDLHIEQIVDSDRIETELEENKNAAVRTKDWTSKLPHQEQGSYNDLLVHTLDSNNAALHYSLTRFLLDSDSERNTLNFLLGTTVYLPSPGVEKIDSMGPQALDEMICKRLRNISDDGSNIAEIGSEEAANQKEMKVENGAAFRKEDCCDLRKRKKDDTIERRIRSH
ncbi:hypothetical protein EJ08DRAFT_647263 [Tothia fuscella]|uniref:Uncharacterized protein n=1 Tax=Tothia fuscella TaxID=1048955 RepID=A0A9P4NYG1_9PEZI|nr:hypothetical protein EJ08DRAFT_647263 [Tothia fuscella]